EGASVKVPGSPGGYPASCGSVKPTPQRRPLRTCLVEGPSACLRKEENPMKPTLLDLYCCAGGAGMGYHLAGFEVFGVDISDQPNYPFQMHTGDAIEYVKRHGHEFDAIHASPPCQGHSGPTKGTNAARNAAQGRSHPDLIDATRQALDATGKPYVIENVMGAPLRRDLVLCGEMFGLGVLQHRISELGGWTTEQP